MKLRTIKSEYLFQRCFKRGKRQFEGPILIYAFQRRDRDPFRFGVAVKKPRCIVERNRLRRVLRAAVRQIASEVMPGLDLIFVCTRPDPSLKSTELAEAMRKALSRGAWRQEHGREGACFHQDMIK